MSGGKGHGASPSMNNLGTRSRFIASQALSFGIEGVGYMKHDGLTCWASGQELLYIREGAFAGV